MTALKNEFVWFELLASKPAARDEIVVAGVAYVTQPDFVWVPFQELLWELPELNPRMASTSASLHLGPVHIVLEAAWRRVQLQSDVQNRARRALADDRRIQVAA